MTRKAIARALSLIVVMAACSRPATKDETLGAYAMNKGKAHDTLIVYPNGTYARRYAASSIALVDSGSWTWDTTRTDHPLTFEKFVARWNDELYPPTRATPASWAVNPQRRFNGTVRIPADGDLGWAYIRIRR